MTIALAAGFTVGLAAMEWSALDGRERIDWLYEHTSVEVELTVGEGNIRAGAVEALLDSGYPVKTYLEGMASGALIRYTLGMDEKPPSTISRKKIPDQAAVGDDVFGVSLRAIGDEDTFLTPAGSGSRVTIMYFDGWDGFFFSEDWEGVFPVVMPKALYDEYGGTIALSWRGFHICETAGYYTGTVDGGGDPILLPLSVYQRLGGERASYSKVHLWLNPALNRDLSPFFQATEEVSAVQSGLRTVIWDEELRLVTAPLEQSVELTEALYPIMLVLSVLTAAGTGMLLTLLSSKDAMILRVQGTTKVRTILMLSLQQAFACFAGLAVGLAGVLLYIRTAKPDLLGSSASSAVLCATLYLTAGVIGAVASSTAMTNKNPLEMLQVKE